MAGGVRDPAFWRRFSVAVHRDEEAAQQATTACSASSKSGSSTLSKKPELQHTESWLDRQQKKRSRRMWICWMFWVCMAGLIAGVVIVVLWLQTEGLLDAKGGSGTAREAESTASAVPGVGQGNGMGGSG